MKTLHVAMHPESSCALSRGLKACSTDYRHLHWRALKPRAVTDALVSLYEQFRPDFVFMQLQQAGIVHDHALHRMRDSIVVNWCGDVRYPLPRWYALTGRLITTTAFSNLTDVKALLRQNIHATYLQTGFD